MFIFIILKLCVHVCLCVSTGACGIQRHHISLELELQVFVSQLTYVLGTTLWSSARIVYTLNH